MLLADANLDDAERIPTDKVLSQLERSVRSSFGSDDEDRDEYVPESLDTLFEDIRLMFGHEETPETQAMSMTDATGYFLDGLQEWVEFGEAHTAMVCVYKYTDDLLETGRFDNFRTLIDLADPDSLAPEILLTLLTTSKMAPPNEVPNRPAFFEAVRHRFNIEFEHDEVARLLDRLQ
jgi:hypothetical protein